MRARPAFTIVELLIVVVVIAILAAITVVAYTGIQNRAYNSAMISAARSTVGLVSAYVAANDSYPSTASILCATTDNVCNNHSATTVTASNSDLMTALRTVGTPAASAPSGNAGGRFGVSYYYRGGSTWNGSPQPVYIYYVLRGTNTNCGLSNISTDANPSSYSAMSTSSSGYSWTNASSNMTGCYIHVDGPTV